MGIKVPGLSRRLQMAAELVRQGAVTADVGCDHGKLSAYLLESGRSPYVFATDIRPMPLKSARELLGSLGLEERSTCLLTDGLSGVPEDKVQDIVIAGIGADVTAGIISAADWLRDPDKHLILVPASKHERLRRFLASEGFAVCSEQAVSDRGHMYTCISACWNGERRELDLLHAWLGDIDVKTPDGLKYLEAVRSRMERILCEVNDRDNASYIEAEDFLRLTEEMRN